MKLIKPLLLISCTLLFTGLTMAQTRTNLGDEHSIEANSQDDPDRTRDLLIELDGTFQIQITSNEFSPLYNKNLFLFIQNNRDLYIDKTLAYSDRIQIFIPSHQAIQDPNYQSLSRVKIILPTEEDNIQIK